MAAGTLNWHELRRWHEPTFRGVYRLKGSPPTLRDRITAALLVTNQRGIVGGVAASALHGANWVEVDAVVDIYAAVRPQRGLIVRKGVLADDEWRFVGKLPVTTPARTAYDLGRQLPRGEALARLDALMRATPFSSEDVNVLIKRYPGARGIRQLRELLPLVDGGAMSPRESWLRLLLIDAGFPVPETQIPIADGRGYHLRTLDMGWEGLMIAAEYDGEQHQTSRAQYVKDLRILPKLERLGWIVVRVIREDREGSIIDRVYRAMSARGWRGRIRRK